MSTALPAPSPAQPVATRSDTHRLDAPPRRVTLLEDRASVRRSGALRLPAGQQRVVIEDVAPVAADRTLVARARGARVVEARVVRRWRVGRAEAPADAAPILAELDQVRLAARELEGTRGILDQRRALTDRAVQLLVNGINQALPWAASFEPAWPRDLEALLAAVRELETESRAAAREVERLRLRATTAEAKLELAGRPSVERELATSIEVDLQVDAAGDVALDVDYMVPCALWRPIHRATLLAGTARFECEGAVWQATGEDWTDVELLFSTARPTQQSEPASLRDDRLRAQRRADKKVDVAIREETIQTTGDGQAIKRKDLPGVDDGGETRTMPASTRASIPSTGRLCRVPVFSFEGPAEVDRIARPERSTLVHLRSKQANGAKHPILAGPLELLRESGYVGRGEVGFVAPGERFTIGWGADDAVRVRREASQEREVARLTGKQTITTKVELSLSNLDAVPVSFTLEERIPVSEVEQVTVEVDPKLTSPPARPDAQGIVAWQVQLPARGTKKVTLVHRLLAASSVKGL